MLPRVLALVIAMPLLTVVADAMGLAGGAVLTRYLLDLPWEQFVARLDSAIADTTFWAGLVKAPVFGLLIALTGHDARPAGARFLARTRPAHDGGGRAVDLPRDTRGCRVRDPVPRNRLLRPAVQPVDRSARCREPVREPVGPRRRELRRVPGRNLRHRGRLGHRQVGAAADDPRPSAARRPARSRSRAWTSRDADDDQLRAVKRRYGVAFQHGALFSSLTVGENIALPVAEAMDLDEESLAALVELRLRMVGLPLETATKYPGAAVRRDDQAHGGRPRPRPRPALLFLDEPTAGLDPDRGCGLRRAGALPAGHACA